MTIKDRINQLLNTARTSDSSPEERADLVNQARSLCREHKIGMSAFDWPLVTEVGSEPIGGEEGLPSTEDATSAPRSIGEMVEQLLMDPSLNYVEIARRVRAHFPHARTTNRSVASTAKSMRASGVDVAPRRALGPTKANKDQE